ncbi:MAG: protein kinase [Bryobacterales bacterium]|nr:protein kinase [Bryobacterales bacterium]
MSPEQWARVKEVFDAAVDLPPGDRLSVLDLRCAGDPALRGEVERLLRQADEAGDFLDAPAVPSLHSLQPGELVNDRYEVDRLIGRGGMGEVYAARDRMLHGELIAIKTLQPELAQDPAMLARFQKEILAARRVTHPNVCRVFEVGVHRGGTLPYFTMELLEGETLAARIKREGGLRAVEAIPLIRQMAEGLHAAHAAGVVHRDFKSGNVMLTGDRAAIMDFGLARAERKQAAAAASASAGDTGVSVSQMAGTVGYMSPEQLMGRTVTAASDIYSFGIVLFEMAAARLPFDGSHLISSAVQRASGQIPWIRDEVPDIDPRWESAIQRCLQPEPANRFPSAAAIAAHFTESERAATWPRPHVPGRRAMIGAALAVAAGVAAYWGWPARTTVTRQDALPWYEKGVESVLAMTHEAGRKKLEQAVRLDPDYAPARAYYAAALNELDQQSAKEEMLKAVSAAQRTRLSDADALRVRALQHMLSREFDAARPVLEQRLALATTDRERVEGHLELSWLGQKRQNAADTRRHIDEALRLNPSSPGAKLRLAMSLGQQQKTHEAALAFGEAEVLFRAASDFEGVAEVLWQESRVMARAGRNQEALQLAGKGIAIASSNGNVFHEARLRLVQAWVHRNLGEVAKSEEIAAGAVKFATEHRLDGVAAVGLIDLGGAYQLAGKPELAEKYFQQGLEAARAGRADYSEARATLSLGSLHVQHNRPEAALPYLERALPFFRNGGHVRETMQALLLLGGAQTARAKYGEAESALGEATRRAAELRDRTGEGQALSFTAMLYFLTGRWPEANDSATRAIGLVGEARGGYHAAHTLSSRARYRAHLGQFDLARADLQEAGQWAQRAPGDQSQLKARLVLVEAEIASMRGDWAACVAGARRAAGMDAEERGYALLVAGVCAARSGGGPVAARKAIADLDAAGEVHLAARGRLWLAEAVNAPGEAAEALRFFEPARNWEAIWRCRRAMGGGAENAALDELRRAWPAGSQTAYFARPDILKFGL